MVPEKYPILPVDEDKNRSSFKRLLLAKQLFLHGLNHSQNNDALDKMIAVHNFHNAIEIALRSIILHYEIRAEKQLNIEFEVMLNEIDNHQKFKDIGLHLPYRQELRNLNQIRNLIQHHAVEPADGTMEDWKVFTRRFLIGVCEEYFQLDFNILSPIEMIADSQIKDILQIAERAIGYQNAEISLYLSKVVFESARNSITDFIPEEPIHRHYVDGIGFVDDEEVIVPINRAIAYAALLSTGINLVDYKHFLSCTPTVYFRIKGSPDAQWGNQHPNLEDGKWAHEFVINAIVHWQTLGLSPSIPEYRRDAMNHLIQENQL